LRGDRFGSRRFVKQLFLLTVKTGDFPVWGRQLAGAAPTNTLLAVFGGGRNDAKEPGGNTGLARAHDGDTKGKDQIGPTTTALVAR